MFAMQNIIFEKIPTLKSNIFADRPTQFFLTVLPVDQKIKLVSPYFKKLSTGHFLCWSIKIFLAIIFTFIEVNLVHFRKKKTLNKVN